MVTSSRKSGSVSPLPIVLASAVAALVASFALTNLLGSDSGSEITRTAEAIAPVAAPATPTGGSPALRIAGAAPAASDIVTGAVNKPAPRYLDAAYSKLHFKPAIDTATNEQCLSCHSEIVDRKVRKTSPAGVVGNDVLAWYQTLDTYSGDQETFHSRHLSSPYAKEVMNLKCNFCHQGHDLREEAPGSSATTTVADMGNFTLRKQVDPSKSCLLCHGAFPATNMGLEGSWSELREGFETEETPNGCLTCHAEQFRTVRHQVNYLNASAIEQRAKSGSSDVCLGCHGGRAWYRISYPYPRHPWPGMDKDVPDWAKDRPSESRAEHQLKK